MQPSEEIDDLGRRIQSTGTDKGGRTVGEGEIRHV